MSPCVTAPRGEGWVGFGMFEGKCLKAKCLKDGLRNGAEVSLRFGLPIVFARRRLSVEAALAIGQFGSLRWPISARSAVYWPAAACPMQKARSGFSGAGSIVAMMKINR